MNLRIKKTKDFAVSLLGNLMVSKPHGLAYIVEDKTWVVGYVGEKIIEGLKKSGFAKARLSVTALGLKNQIVHFGSVNTFLTEQGVRKVNASNKVIATWFHFVPDDQRNQNILPIQKQLVSVHTSCSLTKQKLIALGVEPEKIKVIPLGVDLQVFQPAKAEEKQNIRQKLGIPANCFVVGSFQKDGVGWGEGLEPKLIKGPDVFVKAVEKLAQDLPIFVLLVGPSRGFVKKELSKRGIAFLHAGFLEKAEEVAKYYKALDLYLITSRIEGGPQAILESLACSVPLVSTKVGMAGDVLREGENGFLAEVENVEEIAQKAGQILKNPALKTRLSQNGILTAKDYSWDKIAQRYLKELYLPLA